MSRTCLECFRNQRRHRSEYQQRLRRRLHRELDESVEPLRENEMNINLVQFADLVEELFEPLLQANGFSRLSRSVDQYGSTVAYVNEPRYVKLTANIHPHDFPPHFNVVLGEGSTEFPESDWNAVALWRMQRLISGSEQSKEYDISHIDDPRALVAGARADLKKFHGGFLTNDLTLFRQVRARVNRGREPYKIYSPDKTGSFGVANDAKSANLKERFSKE